MKTPFVAFAIVAFVAPGCESTDCAARLSVNVVGFNTADVSVDGRQVGRAPIFHACVGTGKHMVTVETSDGHHRTLTYAFEEEDYVLALDPASWANGSIVRAAAFRSNGPYRGGATDAK